MTGVKPGWKTTEFWLTIATVYIPTIWGYVHSFVPPTVALELTTAATAVYTVGRVIVKAVGDIKAARAGAVVAPAGATATVTATAAA